MAPSTSRDAETWLDANYELAEGARWVDGRLVFTDILSGRLFAVDSDEQAQRSRQLLALDYPLGAVAPIAGQPGSWIAAAGTGIVLIDPAGRTDWLDRPEDSNPVRTRMNDGVCDPSGRFWAGSTPYDGTVGAGSLYRTGTDGSVVRVLDGLTTVNGPAFTADGTLLYVADSAAGSIFRCTVDPASGDLGQPEVFAQLDAAHGSPDGMTVDHDGCLWVAIWGGGEIRRYHSDGRLLAALPVPAPQPTSVCLHPTDGRLMITTARYGLPTTSTGGILIAHVPATAPAACGYRSA